MKRTFSLHPYLILVFLYSLPLWAQLGVDHHYAFSVLSPTGEAISLQKIFPADSSLDSVHSAREYFDLLLSRFSSTLEVKYPLGSFTVHLSDTFTQKDIMIKTPSGEICLLGQITSPKRAYLFLLFSRPSCGLPVAGGGNILMDFWDQFMQTLHVKSAQLEDQSTLVLSTEKLVPLSLVHMFTKGQTWYGKWGYKYRDHADRMQAWKELLDYPLSSIASTSASTSAIASFLMDDTQTKATLGEYLKFIWEEKQELWPQTYSLINPKTEADACKDYPWVTLYRKVMDEPFLIKKY